MLIIAACLASSDRTRSGLMLSSLTGDHAVSQTNALRREQEGNGGLDQRSQIRPEMGNLRGEPFFIPSVIYPADSQ